MKKHKFLWIGLLLLTWPISRILITEFLLDPLLRYFFAPRTMGEYGISRIFASHFLLVVIVLFLLEFRQNYFYYKGNFYRYFFFIGYALILQLNMLIFKIDSEYCPGLFKNLPSIEISYDNPFQELISASALGDYFFGLSGVVLACVSFFFYRERLKKHFV